MNSSYNSHFQFKFDRRLYDYWRKKSMRYLRWARVQTSGLEMINEETGPALLAPNHMSWQDILFIGALVHRPVSFAATYKMFDPDICHEWLNQYFSQFYKNRVVQQTIRQLNKILAKFLVDRVPRCGTFPAKIDPKQGNFFDQAKDALLRSKLVCIFPEGGFGNEEKLRRFKLGVAKLVLDFYEQTRINVPVYPVGIIGTRRLFHPGIRLGFHVGFPMHIDDYIQQNIRKTLLEFTRQLRSTVAKLIGHGQ